MIRRFLLSLLLVATLAPANTLPDAATLLDKFVEATGGKDAYAALKSQTITADIEFVGQGLKGTNTVISLFPENSYTTMELSGIGKISSGVWKGTVWESSALQGHRLASGEERNLMLRLTDIRAVLNWREHYSKATTEAEETVEGEECYRVVIQPKDGGKPETSWYSKKTGLVIKTRMTLVSPMGELPMEITVSDYRKVGNLLVPHRSIQAVGPQKIESKIREVVVNAEVDPAKLTPPAEIQALIAKQKP